MPKKSKHQSPQPFFSILEDKDVSFSPTNHGLLGGFYYKLSNKLHHKPWLTFFAHTAFIITSTLPAILTALFLPAMSIVAGMLGLLGVVLASKVLSDYHRYEAYTNFQNKMSHQKPPQDLHPLYKTRHLTFNQVFSFKLDKANQIWIAPRLSRFQKPAWRPFYIEGFKPNLGASVDLKADGKNFMALVDSQDANPSFYYKEVMTGKRDKQGRYQVQDLSQLPNSQSRWFTLPVLSNLMFWKRNSRLTAKGHMNRWFMSNAGQLRFKVKDGQGNLHELWNCTTVFIQEGNLIRLCDPFVLEGTELKFSLPPGVTVLDVEASASRVVLLGEKIVKGEPKYCLLERTISYDDLGLNPMMHTSFDKRDKTKRLQPMDSWKEIELPKGFFTGSLNVIQTGQDNQVQISLETVRDGKQGFYYRNLSEKRWGFARSSHQPEVEGELNIPLNPICYLRARNQKFFNQSFSKVQSPHFDEHMLDGSIELTKKNGDKITLTLVQQGSMVKSFLKGRFDKSWVLALSVKDQTPQNIAWFGGKASHAASVVIGDKGVEIECCGHRLKMNSSLIQQKEVRFSRLDLFYPKATDLLQEKPTPRKLSYAL